MTSGEGASFTGARRHLARVAAAAVALGAWWSLLSIPLNRAPFRDLVDSLFTAVSVPVGSSVFIALVLFIFAGALRRRLRVAWLAALVIAIVNLVVFATAVVAVLLVPSLRSGADRVTDRELAVAVLTVIGSGAVVVVLFRNRSAFPARTRRGSFVAALSVLVVGVLGAIVTTFLLSLVGGGTLHGVGERAWWAVQRTVGISLPFGGDGGHAGIVPVGLVGGAPAALALLVALAIYLRGAQSSELMGADEELHVRDLIATTGEHDSLAYFATRRDRSVVFAPRWGGGDQLSGDRSDGTGRRRSPRPGRGLAGRDQCVARSRPPTRLATGGAGRIGIRGHRLRRRRTAGAPPRR